MILTTVPFKPLSDDPYFDELVELVDWGDKTLIDGVRSRVEELTRGIKEELSAIQKQTAQDDSARVFIWSTIARFGETVQNVLRRLRV